MLVSRPVSQRMGGGRSGHVALTVLRRTLPRPEGRWNPTVGVCLGPYDNPTVGVYLRPHGPRRKHSLMNEETVPTGETNACLWSLGDFPSLGTNSGLPEGPSLVQCTSISTESGLMKRSGILQSPLVDVMYLLCPRVPVWTVCPYCALRSKMGG